MPTYYTTNGATYTGGDYANEEYQRHIDAIRNDLLERSARWVAQQVDGDDSMPEVMFTEKDVKGIQTQIKFNTKFKPKDSRTFDYKIKCAACKRIKKKSEMAKLKDVKYKALCKTCAVKSGYYKCSNCGGFYGRKYSTCSCTHKKDKSPKIEVYNYQADWKPFKTKTDAFLFGIELEIELEGKDIKKTNETYQKPYIVYKWDGSLSGKGHNGFELVTMPLGWEWLKEHKEELDSMLNQLSKLGLKSKCTNTCGMHVHINKDVFTTFHLYKFYTFHYENKKLLHYMSGRTWDNMTRWANFKYDDKKSARQFCREKTCKDRHSAVNLQNPETAEVRIFRGTLAPEPFWRNIEFVKAVCDYTRYANVKDLSKTDRFREYVRENSKEFPHLYEYLCDKIKGEILCAS